MRPAHAEKSARVSVRIDVEDSFLLQLGGVRLRPFRGTDQGGLFAVPGAVNDRSLRPPARFDKLADGVRFAKYGDHSTDGIVRAVDPRIVMVCPDDPFIRPLASAQPRDDVVAR